MESQRGNERLYFNLEAHTRGIFIMVGVMVRAFMSFAMENDTRVISVKICGLVMECRFRLTVIGMRVLLWTVTEPGMVF